MIKMPSKLRLPYFLLIALFPFGSYAQFTFTFDKISGEAYGLDCNGISGSGCSSFVSPSDLTRFFQGQSVMIDGQEYMHQILGSLDSGFAQEVFILKSKQGPQCSTSNCFTDGRPTQDPTGVVMRQVLSETDGDDSFYDEFIKDRLDYKAKTTQNIVSGTLTVNFEIDARNELLTETPTNPQPMINTTNIDDTSIPRFIGTPDESFDMATDSQESRHVRSNYFWDTTNEEYNYVDFTQ